MSGGRPDPDHRRVVVWANPHARATRRHPATLDRLREVLGATGEVVAPAARDALHDTAAALAADPPAVLALHGGDGTGSVVLSALVPAFAAAGRVLPELMWLHGGTMNTVSRSMGQRGRPEAQLADLVAELRGEGRKGAPLPRTRRWLLDVEEGRHHGFLWGVGIVPRFIEVYDAGVEPSPVKAGLTLARAIASAFTGGPFAERFFRGLDLAVTVDGTPWPETPWRILTAGTVDDVGLRFRPFPGVLEQPGRLELFGSASPPLAFARDLWPLWHARPARHPLTRAQVGTEVVVTSREGPLRYNLDGDLHTAVSDTVRVRVGPPLTFVLARRARPTAHALSPGP